jgi:tRNA-splicing ligase RtcB
MGSSGLPIIHLTMHIFGTHDDRTREQLAGVAQRARRVALMADGHLGYVMPFGVVAAYENAVSVVGVGFDIACGNAAIRRAERSRCCTPFGRSSW